MDGLLLSRDLKKTFYIHIGRGGTPGREKHLPGGG